MRTKNKKQQGPQTDKFLFMLINQTINIANW